MDKNRKPVSFRGLVQITCLITISLSILTIFNEQHRLLELFSHFRLQYFAVAIAAAIIFILYKRFIFAATLGAIALLNGIYCVSWYFSAPNNQEATLNSIKVIHANILTSNKNHQAFIDLIKREQPEVFVAQEVNAHWSRSLTALHKAYPYRHIVPREDNFGIALFSKHPMSNPETKYWGNDGLPSIQASINLPDIDLPGSNANQPGTGSSRSAKKANSFTIIATHPLPPISEYNFSSRNTQLQEVSKYIEQIEEPVILIGDFNVSMWSNSYRLLPKNLANTRKGFGILPTWPTSLPFMMIPIDHALVSDHFRVNNMETGKAIGSDHLPIIIELSLLN